MDSTTEEDCFQQSMIIPETQVQNITDLDVSKDDVMVFDESPAIIPASDEEYEENDSDGENDPSRTNFASTKEHTNYQGKSQRSEMSSVSFLPATAEPAYANTKKRQSIYKDQFQNVDLSSASFLTATTEPTSLHSQARAVPTSSGLRLLTPQMDRSAGESIMVIDLTEEEEKKQLGLGKDYRHKRHRVPSEVIEIIDLSEEQSGFTGAGFVPIPESTAATMPFNSLLTKGPVSSLMGYRSSPVPNQMQKPHSTANIETSTPVLATKRRYFTPLEELNLTAIDRRESNLNLTVDQEGSSSDDLSAVVEDISQLNIRKPTQLTSKKQIPSSRPTHSASSPVLPKSIVDISSDEEAEKEEFSEGRKDLVKAKKASQDDITVVNLSDASDDASWVGESDEDDSTYNSFDEAEAPYCAHQQQPKSSIADVAPGPSSAARGYNRETVKHEFQGGVEKAIQKFVKIIENMPLPGDESIPLLERPKYLLVDLYLHQKYGLKWLRWREDQFPGGGILADEMGLGKTVMIIGLMLKSREDKKNNPKEDEQEWQSDKAQKLVPSRSTLVICPAGLIKQWESEIKTKTRNISVLSFHGPKRRTVPSVLAQYDFVLTTYPTIASEIPKDKANKSPLARIQWDRVVLDEGHIVRNIKTKAAYAVGVLHANHRWVVTGTPVHNSAQDMFSLISFLRLAPFDDKKVWEHWIGWKANSMTAESSARLHTISKCLLLRRTKEEVNTADPSKKIPPKEVIDKEVELSEQERAIYDHLREFAAAKFKNFLKNAQKRQFELQAASDNYRAGGGRGGHRDSADVNFTHIFSLILRLRQASVLPFLIHTMLEDDEDSDLDSSLPETSAIISMKNPCFDKKFKSAKVTQLLEDIDAIKFIAEQNGVAMDKVVVISQWTKLLEILNYHLKEAGYSTASITGKQSLEERDDVMQKLNSRSSRPQVLLLSLMAGGVGLNLVGANHVFFMDIHWNPQLELQAQDRCHRFGQTKNVVVTRYVSKDTMDERVVVLQNQKLDLAAGILSSSKNAGGGGLNVNQMRLLFDL